MHAENFLISIALHLFLFNIYYQLYGIYSSSTL